MHNIKFNKEEIPFSEYEELVEGLVELSNYMNAVDIAEMEDEAFPACPFSDKELVHLLGEIASHFQFNANITSKSGHSVVVA